MEFTLKPEETIQFGSICLVTIPPLYGIEPTDVNLHDVEYSQNPWARGTNFVVIHDYDKFNQNDYTDEFKDHINVRFMRAIKDGYYVGKFLGKLLPFVKKSECMISQASSQGPRDPKITSYIKRCCYENHKGLYLILISSFVDYESQIYAKFLHMNVNGTAQCVFMNQPIIVNLNCALLVDYICITCRDGER